MGNTSSESTANKKHKSVLKNYQKTLSEFKKSNQQVEKHSRLYKWKEVLIDFLKNEEYYKNPKWTKFKILLQKAIEDLKTTTNIEWLINAQHMALTSPTYSSHFTNPDTSRVLDFDQMNAKRLSTDGTDVKLTVSFMGTCLSDPVKSSNFSMNSSSDGSTDNATMMVLQFEDSPVKIPDEDEIKKMKKRAKIGKMLSKKRSAKEELKQSLYKQLSTPHHVIDDIIKFSLAIFDNIYTKEYQDLALLTTWDEKTEKLYEEIRGMILNIVDFIKSFVIWIYHDLIKQLAESLENEDLDHEYIIEAIIYDFIFKSPDSINYMLVLRLLYLKHKSNMESFREILKQKAGKKLEEYDEEHFKENREFLMEDLRQPYQIVSNSIDKLRLERNPYLKFEIIVLLEQAVFDCLQDYHKDDPKTLESLKEGFSMDIKVPIIIYSIVQSNNEQLLVELEIIESFIKPSYKENTQSYITFCSCLDFLKGKTLTPQELPL